MNTPQGKTIAEILHEHLSPTCEMECNITHFEEDVKRAVEEIEALVNKEVIGDDLDRYEWRALKTDEAVNIQSILKGTRDKQRLALTKITRKDK